MDIKIDKTDQEILRALQKDASLSLEALAEHVSLSRNSLWRRVKLLEEQGVIRQKVALVSAEKLGLGLDVFVFVKAKEHSPQWLESLRHAVDMLPEIMGAYRMSGELDYLIRIRVSDVKGYDHFYKRFVQMVSVAELSASFVVEELKDSHALPI